MSDNKVKSSWLFDGDLQMVLIFRERVKKVGRLLKEWLYDIWGGYYKREASFHEMRELIRL